MRRACAKVVLEMGTMRMAPAWISLENESRTACSSAARNSLRKMRQLSALMNSNSAKSVARRGGLYPRTRSKAFPLCGQLLGAGNLQALFAESFLLACQEVRKNGRGSR